MAGVSLDSLSSTRGLDAGSDVERNDRVGLKQLYERYWTDLCRHIRATFGSGAADPQDVAEESE